MAGASIALLLFLAGCLNNAATLLICWASALQGKACRMIEGLDDD